MTTAGKTLLPCPFCGGDALAEDVSNFLGDVRWKVVCQNDLCPTNESLPDQKAAIAAWNKRTDLRADDGLVSDIEQAVTLIARGRTRMASDLKPLLRRAAEAIRTATPEPSDAVVESQSLHDRLMVEIAYCRHAELPVSEEAKRIAAIVSTRSRADGDALEGEVARLREALLMARSWVNNHATMCRSHIPAASPDGPPTPCDCSLPERLRIIDAALAPASTDVGEGA